MAHIARRTRFIFTIGPATESQPVLEALLHSGVEICRINMAHATHEWTRKVTAAVRKASEVTGKPIALLMDVKGPEIRTGQLEQPIVLEENDRIHFIFDPEAHVADDLPATTVNYPHIGTSLKSGATLLVDNGLLRFEVMDIRAGSILCRTIVPGTLTSRRHVNLPGTRVSLPAITEKDQHDLKLAAELGMDFIALSFVREADDVVALRKELEQLESSARIIAKIEDQSAIDNLYGIINESDGLMVARGDLGIECPFESLPGIQQNAVAQCLRLGKPVIIATHVLESMISNPIPTRAEVTDAANAIWERADAIMLSGETSMGKYPVESIQALHRIAHKVENEKPLPNNFELPLRTAKTRMLRSASTLADELGGAGLVVFTRNGLLPQILSSLRPPRSPIFAFTDLPELHRQLLLLWGVQPFLLELGDNPESTLQEALSMLLKMGHVQMDETLVVITNILVPGERIIDTIQLRKASYS